MKEKGQLASQEVWLGGHEKVAVNLPSKAEGAPGKVTLFCMRTYNNSLEGTNANYQFFFHNG